jgi:hypothetical protein
LCGICDIAERNVRGNSSNYPYVLIIMPANVGTLIAFA